jgi:hypothetical protein
MTASKLQAENKELRERMQELQQELAIGVNVIRDYECQIESLIKENHRLADIIMNKEEKGQ